LTITFGEFLRRAVQFGWLDHEQADPSIPVYNVRGREVALEAARSSMVLLKITAACCRWIS